MAFDVHLNKPVEKSKILIVDDIPVNIQLQETYLSSLGFHTIVAHNGIEALKKVSEEHPDLILLDVMMPKMNGFETCKHLKRQKETRHIPIIMVTALNELEDKIKGLEAGADDFITKPFNKLELLARVKSLLRIKYLHDELQEKVIQLEEAQQRLKELAITDGMTGLYNYRHFKDRLGLEFQRAERSHAAMSLVMMDIDYFKHYNDTNGHLAGDEVLRMISYLIRQNVRQIDLPIRYGGEEFALLLVDTEKKDAIHVAEKIKGIVERSSFKNESAQPNGKITLSMGVAAYPDDVKTPDELISIADQRLYRAKALGRNLVIAN